MFVILLFNNNSNTANILFLQLTHIFHCIVIWSMKYFIYHSAICIFSSLKYMKKCRRIAGVECCWQISRVYILQSPAEIRNYKCCLYEEPLNWTCRSTYYLYALSQLSVKWPTVLRHKRETIYQIRKCKTRYK